MLRIEPRTNELYIDEYTHIWNNAKGEDIDKALALFCHFSGYGQPLEKANVLEETLRRKDRYGKKRDLRLEIIISIRALMDEYFLKNGYLHYRNTIAASIEFLLFTL